MQTMLDGPGTTIFVASNGGHLAQLFQLAQRMGGQGDRLWVSFEGTQARSLLAGERSVLIPYIATRSIGGVMRGMGIARDIFAAAGRVRAVVSTGAAIALSFLPYAALRNVEAHYIESAARVNQLSLTGRVLGRLPRIRLYRQYPDVARGRWRYGGSVFDGFCVADGGRPRIRRVLVTVGSDRAFLRMVERCAHILPRDVEVVWQTGPTPLAGLGLQARPFVAAGELFDLARSADVIISHAGCGSALMALQAGKCPILVPRDPCHGEVVDAHQQEIADWLSHRGLALKREVGELTFDDLEMAAARAVAADPTPPPFQLSRTG